jgi:flagellar biogenesis protein FliO
MTYVARAITRGRIVVGAGRRLVTTVESSMLAQNVSVHVVRVGAKYYLVGGGTAGVSLLAELSTEDVEPYIEAQRAALAQQRDTLMRPFARFKKS